MIERIYIDNFRSYSNFRFEPARTTLILGDNGTGKTSLFDLVDRVRKVIVDGRRLEEMLPTRTLTRWDQRERQRFEFGMRRPNGNYGYELEVVHDRKREVGAIARELVTFEGTTLFHYEDGHVHLHRDDGAEYTSFPFGSSRSFLSETEERQETTRLPAFVQFFSDLRVLKLDPATMTATTSSERQTLARDGSNFASWFRHLQQEQPEGVHHYTSQMRGVLPGFDALKLTKVSTTTRELVASFARGAASYDVRFDELSDGQRALFVLYALLIDIGDEPRCVLLDEPGNALSLREVQPYLCELTDALGDGGQLIVASHNAEVINSLAAESPVVFQRKDGGPVQVAPGRFDRESGLMASEQLARGWLDAE